MKNHKSLFTIHLSLIAFLLVISVSAFAQSNIENILAEIRKNNKTIQATSQYYEAQNLQYKTGNTPANPTVEYDFLSGSPANAGNQHDFIVVQQFDFPTAYIKKAQLVKTQTAQTEFQLIASKQDVLLEAKKHCIELVYQNKLQIQLAQQKQNTEKLLADFQTKLDKGEGNILDVNKAKLQLIQIKKQVQQNISDIAQHNQKLTALNGGNAITFTDTTYPTLQTIPPFEQLEKEYENADPLRKILQQEKLITQKQVELSKSMLLPKMELGYHYQGILGQTYNGIHTGISIPLWENKNTVKQKQAQLLFSDLQLQIHSTEHYYEIKNLYEKYTNLKITLHEYQTIFATLNNTTLLNKALALGELTTIQYFMEINYYTEALNNFLQTEKEYHAAIAELYKHRL
jgi:outer membrane protein, heavy metal efflux system